MEKGKTCRVLMIGNSYTYFNSLWDILADAASNIGYDFRVDQVTKGGYLLAQHADPKDVCGAQIELLLSSNMYDFVFLQDNSLCPVLDHERFVSGATKLNDRIQVNGAKTVLYQTWARKPGSPTLVQHKLTVEGMNKALETAYTRLGKELNAAVSPVGSVFFRMATDHPEIELYDPDMTHPSLAGSYLAAICHLVTLTGVDPSKITFDAGLDPVTAKTIRQSVADVINR